MGSDGIDGIDPQNFNPGNRPVTQSWRWGRGMCVQVTDLPWFSNQPIEG